MEKYIAKWYSQDTGATTDITSRCGGVSTSDDLDSLAVTMSMDVQQSSIDPYHNRDIELSCDEAVVRTFGETQKSAYAMTLIGLEEKRSELTPFVNNFSKNAIEERIISIMKIKKVSRLGILLALVLVLGTAIFFATSASA